MIPKVTVITPVYKAEKDIERCCRALFGQTLDNIEYVFVDDCSPDNSVDIIMQTLEDYPERKPFVKVLHQEKNSGVSACRQLGLQNATGDFVIHCDSDDWPDVDMYQTLLDAAKREEAEVVCCDYMVECEGSSKAIRFPDKYVARPSLGTDPIEGAVWNKLISRNLIDRCGAEFYHGINLGEDFGFVTPCRVMSKKNAVVHRAMYHYNQMNQNSLTHNYSKPYLMQVIDLAKRTEAYFIKHGLEKEYEWELCNMKFVAKMYYLVFSDVRDIPFWRSLFPECHKYISTYNVPGYLKLAAWLIANGLSPMGNLVLTLKSKIVHN